MKRREFIGLLAGAVALRPSVLRAQDARLPTIGILVPADPEPFRSTFEDGLRRFDYRPGQNVQIEFRSAEGRPQRLAQLAAELVRLNVSVLIAAQTPAVFALKQATSTIPIVMSSGDPVGTGLIASLAKPGGNITGLSSTSAELSGKTLELIREVLPRARRVAVLANETDPFTKPYLAQLQLGSNTLGLDMRPTMIGSADELGAAVTEMLKWRAEAVVVQPSLPRQRIIQLTRQHRLPAVSLVRAFSVEGGLMSYGAQLAAGYLELAGYVDKILKGAKPSELPVQQPTKYELVVNLTTAKAIGLRMPPTLLARADEVIE